MAKIDQAAGAAPAPDGSPHVDWRLALLSIAGFWVFYFGLTTFRALLMEDWDQWAMAARRAFVAVAGAGVTFLLYLVLRAIEGRSTRTLVTTVFLAAIPVSFGYASFNYFAFYVVDPLDSVRREIQALQPYQRNPAYIISDHATGWYFFIVAWGVMYVALSYAAKVRKAERSAALYRAEAQSAQLRALRYQINPHFLFNTLNSLSTLILRNRNDEAERMTLNLANFFRATLVTDPAADVPLGDEVRMQRLYLDIERTRFPDRLRVEIDVPAELEGAAVPGLLLQPIVENAIKYGVARSRRPVTVAIRARAFADRLNLTVEDDGEAIPTKTEGNGVGLRNVCDRLATRFDGAAECRYGKREGRGFKVMISLPLAWGVAAQRRPAEQGNLTGHLAAE